MNIIDEVARNWDYLTTWPPPWLLDPSHRDTIIIFLQAMQLPPLTAKLLFIDWAKQVNYGYGGNDIARVTGLPPGSL